MEGEIKRQISQMMTRRRTSINVAAMLNPGRKSIFSDPKLKVFRELNHDDVTEDHRKFFNMVAYHFNLTEDEVENSALSSPNATICGRLKARCSEEGSMIELVSNQLNNIYMPCFSVGSDWIKNKLTADKNRILVWMRLKIFLNILKVIAESGQIRMEADDVGPLYELRYWRYVLCRLSSVVEFVQSNKFLTVIKLLTAAQSRILKPWMEQDRKLTDKINEARDNVKYLHQLEKFVLNSMKMIWKTESSCSLKLILKQYIGNYSQKSIPLLISQVQMIHAISRFYHTPEHITSFFTKVTNQIVVVCKNYITESGKVDLWTLPRQEAISRMNKCVKLEKNYKRSLEKVRKRVSSEIGKRNFEFFQVPVLGAFSSFSKRLNTICEMFDVIDGMSVLNKCHIEGIEVFSSKLNNIVNGMKGKTYDLLDHRKLDFDNDYKEFTNQIAELKVSWLAS
ncbi:dynein gamma chain, flagellar outer arm [Caerostris extrusa]|uniref:Dynein gamma chain, flagellar outer arm n=1 Tax=Caerostris extrusa TaxID=172846 RepID=A0AAV4VSC7_CAEEX|nr:dynein gamma chain, flagellar outer arm [Caerostris extrusa]